MAATLMQVTVTHVDGSPPVTHTILPITRVAFERQYKVGIGSIGDDFHEEYMLWMAWDSEKRVGKVVPPFDDWLGNVASIESEEEAVPLAAGPTPT